MIFSDYYQMFLLQKKIEVVDEIRKDILIFIEEIKEDKPNLRDLGIRNTSFDEMLEILTNKFLNYP